MDFVCLGDFLAFGVDFFVFSADFLAFLPVSSFAPSSSPDWDFFFRSFLDAAVGVAFVSFSSPLLGSFSFSSFTYAIIFEEVIYVNFPSEMQG